mgnify:CR=1 FL=1
MIFLLVDLDKLLFRSQYRAGDTSITHEDENIEMIIVEFEVIMEEQ